MSSADGSVEVRTRARPMSPDERRSDILDAVIPLLREHGRDVSTKQIAEAAGVAEGTIFRAFGDKEAIISAAMDRYFDPEPFRAAMRAIDPDAPTTDKIRQALGILRDRFAGVIGFMAAFRGEGAPPPRRGEGEQEWLETLAQLFRPDELSVPVTTLGFYLRLLAFGAAMPPITSAHAFTLDELLQLVTHGVLPAAASESPPPSAGKKD